MFFDVLNFQNEFALLKFILLTMRLDVSPSYDGQLGEVTELWQIVSAAMTAEPADLVVSAVHFLSQLLVLVHIHSTS